MEFVSNRSWKNLGGSREGSRIGIGHGGPTSSSKYYNRF